MEPQYIFLSFFILYVIWIAIVLSFDFFQEKLQYKDIWFAITKRRVTAESKPIGYWIYLFVFAILDFTALLLNTWGILTVGLIVFDMIRESLRNGN